MSSHVWMWELVHTEGWALMLSNCSAREDSWKPLGLQGDQTSQSERKSIMNIHWKDWCWSWSSNTLSTWWEVLTQLKRPWCWERLKAGGEGNDRGWDGWMASLTQWTRVWANSRSSKGQGSLACCSPWGLKESDTTEWLNNKYKYIFLNIQFLNFIYLLVKIFWLCCVCVAAWAFL